LKRLFIFMLLLFLFTLVACKSDDAAQPVEEPETEIEEEIVDPEETVFPYHAPLTGLGSMVELNQRIMAVMINNHNRARPQSGLDQADIVYEILAEGWITRLVAFYHSQAPEVIGPVRSLRPYLIDLATGYDAIFAHAGGSNDAIAIVQKRGLPSLDEIYNSGGSFYRVNFRKAPHNLYTNMELLRKGAERRKYAQESNLPIIPFRQPDDVKLGDPAGWIEINYHSSYSVAYEYDPETESYTRYVQGEPHVDLETNKPLTMTNLLVIDAPHKVLDNEGRREINLLNGGKGYLFQKGKVEEVDWQRIDGVIRPLKNGQEVGYYPGVTWVNVIPTQPGLERNVSYKATRNAE